MQIFYLNSGVMTMHVVDDEAYNLPVFISTILPMATPVATPFRLSCQSLGWYKAGPIHPTHLLFRTVSADGKKRLSLVRHPPVNFLFFIRLNQSLVSSKAAH